MVLIHLSTQATHLPVTTTPSEMTPSKLKGNGTWKYEPILLFPRKPISTTLTALVCVVCLFIFVCSLKNFSLSKQRKARHSVWHLGLNDAAGETNEQGMGQANTQGAHNGHFKLFFVADSKRRQSRCFTPPTCFRWCMRCTQCQSPGGRPARASLPRCWSRKSKATRKWRRWPESKRR